MARRTAAIRDVETEIETGEGIRVENDDLDGEVEAVKSSLVVEPSRVCQWSASVANAGPVGCADAEESRGEEDEGDAGAHAALLAEVVDRLVMGDEDGAEDDRDGDEGQDREVCTCEQTDLAQF